MKKISLFILSVTTLFGLNKLQINNLKLANYWGNQFSAINGHKFNNTLQAIILTESSAGKYLIGDNYDIKGKEKPFLLKSLGLCQIKLETAIITIKENKDIFKQYLYLIHDDNFSYKKYIKYINNIIKFKDIIKRYKKKYKKDIDKKRDIKVLKWAKKELRLNYKHFNKYKNYYKKDLELTQLLVSDKNLNLAIATLYLIKNYNLAIKRHYKNPYFKTISRYNGGWNNKIYYKRVIKNLKLLRKYKGD